MTRKYKKALPSLALFAGTVCSFSIISVRITGMAAWLLFITGLSLYNLVKEYGQIQKKDILTGSIVIALRKARKTTMDSIALSGSTRKLRILPVRISFF